MDWLVGPEKRIGCCKQGVLALNSHRISTENIRRDAFFVSSNGIWKCQHDTRASCESIKYR